MRSEKQNRYPRGIYGIITVSTRLVHTAQMIPRIEYGRTITMAALIVHVLMFYPFGKLTDRIGRYRRVMAMAAVILAVSAVPMFILLNIGSVDCDTAPPSANSSDDGTCSIISGNFTHCPESPVSEATQVGATIIVQMFMTSAMSLYGTPLPVWMVTSFPPEVRYTAVGIGYNIAQACLGGTSPLIATGMISATNWNPAPSIFLIVCAIVSGVTLLYMEFGHMCSDEKSDSHDDDLKMTNIGKGAELDEIGGDGMGEETDKEAVDNGEEIDGADML